MSNIPDDVIKIIASFLKPEKLYVLYLEYPHDHGIEYSIRIIGIYYDYEKAKMDGIDAEIERFLYMANTTVKNFIEDPQAQWRHILAMAPLLDDIETFRIVIKNIYEKKDIENNYNKFRHMIKYSYKWEYRIKITNIIDSIIF